MKMGDRHRGTKARWGQDGDGGRDEDGTGTFGVPAGMRPTRGEPWAPRGHRGGDSSWVPPQVLAWGLRGLRGGVRAPSLEVQCGGRTLRTPTITDLATNPNFPINAFLLTLVRMGGGRGSSPPMGAATGTPG